VKYMRLKFPYEIRNGNSSLKARFLTVNEQNWKMNLIIHNILRFFFPVLNLQESKSKIKNEIPIYLLKVYETFVCLMKEEVHCHYHWT